MKLTEVETAIGFADGEILKCERIGGVFIVDVNAWNSKRLRVEFREVLMVTDMAPRDISGFYRYDEDTELMRKALNYAFVALPKEHLFKHFAFMNNDGEPCLEVVAAKVDVTSE